MEMDSRIPRRSEVEAVKISPQTLALVQRIAAKLNEKSSVWAYLIAFAGQFLAAKYQADIRMAISIASMTAGIVLWLLSDEQVRYLLTGQKQVEPKTPTVPPNQG